MAIATADPIATRTIDGRESCARDTRCDKALVIGDDIGVFLSVARSLGRAGVDVDVATCGENYPGLSSRYVQNVRILPPYLTQPSNWLAALQALTEREEYRLIIPTSDSSLGLLALAAETIGRDKLAIPNDQALAAFTSKSRTRALAASLAVKIAQGRNCVASSEAFELFADGPFPQVLKPSQPYVTGGRDAKTSASIVHTPEQLSTAMKKFEGREIVVENFFAGEGVGVSVLAKRGEVRRAWQHRRLAAAGEAGRSSRRIGESPDPVLLRDVYALSRATDLTGVAMFEFRQDPATRDHILLEVNPRFWGSLALAVSSDADFPALLWQMLTGGSVGKAEEVPVQSIPMISLSADLDRLSDGSPGLVNSIRRSVDVIALLARAKLSPSRFDGWAKDDPRPHWAEVGQVAARLRQAAMRRLF
ncbi:MAG: ATP-grasp domain-containing protein [Parasphingopyxis sp.]|uniref:carboxylate--amine ligase n=1 Tax=Parasphingopyxis sp. TaxID=1920299 RepID=UPI0032EDFA43